MTTKAELDDLLRRMTAGESVTIPGDVAIMVPGSLPVPPGAAWSFAPGTMPGPLGATWVIMQSPEGLWTVMTEPSA